MSSSSFEKVSRRGLFLISFLSPLLRLWLSLLQLLLNPDGPVPSSFLECTDTSSKLHPGACRAVLPAAAAALGAPRSVPCVSDAPQEEGDNVSTSKDKPKKGRSLSAVSSLPWGMRIKKDVSFARELMAQRGAVSSLLPEWSLEWLRRVLSLIEVSSKPDVNKHLGFRV